MNTITEETPKDGRSNTILTQGKEVNLKSEEGKATGKTARAIIRATVRSCISANLWENMGLFRCCVTKDVSILGRQKSQFG